MNEFNQEDQMGRYTHIGQQFGNYRLTKGIAHGGFAEVYSAEHTLITSQIVAIKILIRTEHQAMFLQEAQMAMRLHGPDPQSTPPHIIQVLDYGVENNIPYLIMGFAAHGTLRDRHPRWDRKAPLSMLVSYVKQIGEALQYAHDQGVIHRDIKPENMLLNSKDEILLSDFGIAEYDSSTTPRDDFFGTPAYMAPERFDGRWHRASDQYSVAVVVYELLYGQLPFQGRFDARREHPEALIPFMRRLNPSISEAVEAVIVKALAHDYHNRYESVQEFADALEKAANPKPKGTDQRKRKSGISRRRVVIAAALAAAAVVTTGGGGITALVLLNDETIGPKHVYTYTGHKAPVTEVAWFSGGLIASGDEEGWVHVWNVDGKLAKKYHKHQGRVTGISWFPDGQHIATTGDDSILHIWDTLTGIDSLNPYPKSPVQYSMLTVAWSPGQGKPPTSDHLALGSGPGVLILDNPLQYKYSQHDYMYTEHHDDVLAIAWPPNVAKKTPNDAKKIIASASVDKTVQVWEIYGGKRHVLYQGHIDTVRTIAWSLDGKLIASGSDDKTVQVWDAATGVPLFVKRGLPGSVNSVAWVPNPQGRYLVWATADGFVEVWDVDKKRRIYAYQGYLGSINALTSSTSGSIASGGDDTIVQVWEL